jgi:hypothetical protein
MKRKISGMSLSIFMMPKLAEVAQRLKKKLAANRRLRTIQKFRPVPRP